MFKPKSIYSVLKPMFFSTKLIGFAPFNLSENNFSVTTVLNLLWSIAIMCFLGGISFFSLTNRTDDAALITRVTDYLHTRLCITSLCWGILFACIFRGKIVEVINDIALFDKELKILDIKFNIRNKYRISKIYVMISTSLLWIYMAGLFALDIAAFTRLNFTSIGQIFAYVAPVLTTFIELQFCCIVMLLKERFLWLNDKMLELGKNYDASTYGEHRSRVSHSKVSPFYVTSPTINLEREKTLSTMQQISIQHHRLCTICEKLNTAYSFQILLIVLQAFMTIIAVSFYTARLSFSNRLSIMPVIQQMYYFNMLILHFAIIIILVIICSTAAKEAQKTGILLHNVISLNVAVNSGYMDLGVTCFSLQLIHHNVKFTACKLFIIDETLLYSIAGAATTYLVIVLQFEFGVSVSEPPSDVQTL